MKVTFQDQKDIGRNGSPALPSCIPKKQGHEAPNASSPSSAAVITQPSVSACQSHSLLSLAHLPLL